MVENIKLAFHSLIFLLLLAYATSEGCYLDTDNPENKLPCLMTRRTGDNILVSSVSIRVALGLAYLASANDTRNEIKEAMDFNRDNSGDVLDNREFENIRFYLNNFKTLRMDTTIFHNNDLQLEKSFLNGAENEVFAKKSSINFRETENAINQINSVIENVTNNEIKNFVTDEVINNETNIVFENSLHFNAEWKHPFNESHTEYMDFYIDGKTKKKVKSMRQINKFRHFFIKALNATAIELPFKKEKNIPNAVGQFDDNPAMLILLPKSKSKSALKDLQNKLVNKDMYLIRHRIYYQCEGIKHRPHLAYLQLPVFKLERQRIRLNEMFKEMNITAAFSSRDDFTPMLKTKQRSFLKTVSHAAFVNIMEKGVTAGGVTDMTFENRYTELNLTKRNKVDQPQLKKYATRRAELPNLDVYARKLKKFIINRPFIFAIVSPPSDNSFPTPLFLGTISNDNFSSTTLDTTNGDPTTECVGSNGDGDDYDEYGNPEGLMTVL